MVEIDGVLIPFTITEGGASSFPGPAGEEPQHRIHRCDLCGWEFKLYWDPYWDPYRVTSEPSGFPGGDRTMLNHLELGHPDWREKHMKLATERGEACL